MRSPRPLALFASLAFAAPAFAQRTVAYDTVSDGTPAAVTCGFCAGEKFGVVFYELPSGGGLRADELPLTLSAIQLAVARVRVVGSALSGGYTCQGSNADGSVDLNVEVYAGQTVPTDIRTLPATGEWPGETAILETEATATVSVATTDGGSEFNVTLNEIVVPDGGVRIDPPNTYLRVVVRIPSGGSSSSCSELSMMSPGAVAIRDDDGRVAPRRSLIWAAGVDVGIPGVGIPSGWYWNEDVPDDGGGTGINGDWAIRVVVQSVGSPPTDAGVTPRDAGADDGGMSEMDAAVPADAGDGSCSLDRDCGGGERCVMGRCERTTCTRAEDCGGGRTCVDGRCRNLCDVDRDCEGGEVCSTAGECRPAGDSGGCGCSLPGRSGSGAPALVALGLVLLALRRRR